MYLSLWDSHGNEASFPGYCRQPVEMEVSAGRAANRFPVVWPLSAYCPMNIATLKIHQRMWDEAVLECRLDRPITGALGKGDTVSINASSITAELGGMANSFIGRAADITVETFDAFMERRPGATLREIWEAAFVAGHQTAHTLLTGDTE
jgi:hypothetical protein